MSFPIEVYYKGEKYKITRNHYPYSYGTIVKRKTIPYKDMLDANGNHIGDEVKRLQEQDLQVKREILLGSDDVSTGPGKFECKKLSDSELLLIVDSGKFIISKDGRCIQQDTGYEFKMIDHDPFGRLCLALDNQQIEASVLDYTVCRRLSVIARSATPDPIDVTKRINIFADLYIKTIYSHQANTYHIGSVTRVVRFSKNGIFHGKHRLFLYNYNQTINKIKNIIGQF